MASWTWTYDDTEGTPLSAEGVPPQPAEGFCAQADAETWVGEQWRALVAAGAGSAHLWVDGNRVYGPLGLRPS